MNKEYVIGGILIVGAAVSLFLFRSPFDPGSATEKTISSKKSAVVDAKPQKKSEQKNPVKVPLAENEITPTVEEDAALTDEEALAEEIELMPGAIAIDRDLATPLVMVNDVEVALGDVMPPGILTPGEPMAESGYNAFVNMAIDRQLVVQKAEEMGLVDSETHQQIVETMRAEFEDTDPSASKEDIEWEVNYFATSAIVNEVYKKEGLVPKKVTDEEVDEYYEARSADYNWLRERERARGTREDRIEKRVKKQIEDDLRTPRSREVREKRAEFHDGLRGESNIEFLPSTSSRE